MPLGWQQISIGGTNPGSKLDKAQVEHLWG
jgi:hypothetical protein